ncbi:MAG: hypothetical protein KDB94_12280, partial [Acidobacteria bacterium]|nr:hypothetical protein [Acidobacteriota bacterium]
YFAVPLVWLGSEIGDPLGELSRFLFSWTNAFFVAAAVALLALFYLELGVRRRAAIGWSLVAAFASMLWIGATTVLEQGQHAFFSLAGLYLAWRSAKQRSVTLALGAGLASGTLMLYQLPYALLQPTLALATLGGGRARDRIERPDLIRYVAFGVASVSALCILFLYNFNRFGVLVPDPLRDAPWHPRLFGNPVAGVISLLVSPGKGILLFSPTIVIALLGLSELRRREGRLFLAVVFTSLLELLFIGSLSIFHADWCWGPRYLIVLLPLLALAFPFAFASVAGRSVWRRRLAVATVVLGVFANLLGLSLVHERYFHEKGFSEYFWRGDPWFYFSHSNYFARIGELAETLRHGIPAESSQFNHSPYPGLLTYVTTRAGPPRSDPPWLREFRVFYRPRPWPIWLAAERRDWARGAGLPYFWWLVAIPAALALAGTACLLRELRRNRDPVG